MTLPRQAPVEAAALRENPKVKERAKTKGRRDHDLPAQGDLERETEPPEAGRTSVPLAWEKEPLPLPTGNILEELPRVARQIANLAPTF